MMLTKMMRLIPALLLAACTTNAGAPGAVTVSMADLMVLAGGRWSGTLSYLNYNAEHRSTIPVELKVAVLDNRTLEYAIRYPGEEQHNARETLKLSRDGSRINGDLLVSRQDLDNGGVVLVTESEGRDDNRAASIRLEYTVSANEFRIRKNVRFDGENDYFNRNEYAFER